MIEENTTTIGIDLGTSHCTAAVWDSTRGHPKWMRLSGIAYPEATKEGRVVPSAILFLTKETARKMNIDTNRSSIVDLSTIFPAHPSIVACVGATAVEALDKASSAAEEGTSHTPSYADLSAALVTSAKRLFGLSHLNEELKSSLSLPVTEPQHGGDELVWNVRPMGYRQQILPVTPSQATTILLLAIRLASEAYLKSNGRKKKLHIPGGEAYRCSNAVIGVPAHYGQSQRLLVTRAAQKAGITGLVSVLTESTAAAMAYGIFVSRMAAEKTILVFDSGGGTTDVTIATMAGKDNASEDSQRFRVVVTEGEPSLGGDDMDAALLAVAMKKTGISEKYVSQERRRLLNDSRRAKERLCGDVDHGYQKPESSVSLSISSVRASLTQDDLEEALGPWIDRGTKLVRRALERYASEKNLSMPEVCMDEVILVGGATRVPAVRRMLREIFPPPVPADLCLSVNAMAAVAQGAAIQAAMQSERVPAYEVRSAMMLDTVPHAIGVLLPDSETFVEIISQDTALPASGSAVFQLADPQQPGVTLTAVEQVDGGRIYPKLGEFTFLLARMSREKLDCLDGPRSIEIRMTLRETGEFLVSYYDENDPEHAGMKPSSRRYDKQSGAPVLAFRQEDGTKEQLLLMVSCVVLLFAYVAARIYFQEELSAKSE